MLHEEQLIQQLFKKMETLLFDFAVLGGYPRDIHFGRTPKDLDICVYNYTPHDIADNKFTAMLGGWLYQNKITVVRHYSESCASASGDSRVHMVWTLSCGVDIIFWNAKTKTEVLQNFDFNINQFELDTITGEAIDRRSNSDNKELMMLRDLFQYNDNPEERIIHVMQIAKEVGWDICSVKNNLISRMKSQ